MKAITLILLAMVLPLVAQTASPRVALVDMTDLYKSYHKTRVMTAKIAEKQTAISNDQSLQAIRDQAAKISELLARQTKEESPERKEALLADIELERNTLVLMQRETNQRLTLRKKLVRTELVEGMEALLAELTEIVNRYAADNDFALVFDSGGFSSSQAPVILYSKNGIDITEDVRAILAASAPSPATAAPAEEAGTPARTSDQPAKEN